jgi:hypothetical protein
MMFDGGDTMKLSVGDFRQALDIIGDAGGSEAAIVAQFALDLAVTARFKGTGAAITPEKAQQLLGLRIARHRAAQYTPSTTVR